jgi:hypothetical protein
MVQDAASGVRQPFERPGIGAAQYPAAGRVGRMRVDHGVAPVQLVEHRLEQLFAQPVVAVAGQQANSVGLQRVESVLDFFKAGINVRQGQ